MQPIYLQDKCFYVVIGCQQAEQQLLEMAAWLCLKGPIFIVDAGNRMRLHTLARTLRRKTQNPIQALKQIQLSRAFTCFQVVTLLEQLCSSSPPMRPVMVFDLPATFCDENVSWDESRRLFTHCLDALSTLCHRAPVLASAYPFHSALKQRQPLINQLCEKADKLWVEEPPPLPLYRQLSLFPEEN